MTARVGALATAAGLVVVGLVLALAISGGSGAQTASLFGPGADGRDEGRPVTVSGRVGGRWRPCPDVDPEARPVRGGCVLFAHGEIAYSLKTPFGRMPLARCQARYTLRIDARGTVVFDGVAASGASPCADIRACELETDADKPPWLGRLSGRRANDLEIAMDACYDTCAGGFAGELVLDLEHVGGQWRVSAERAEVARSGIELHGDWWLDGSLRVERG
jgi:hypothetical protein